MERKEFTNDLASFIDTVMSPSESFARLFDGAYDCLDSDRLHVKAEFVDVALVSGALTSLTRHRLHQFAIMLQEQVGQVYVKEPNSDQTVEVEITGVEVQGKTTEALKQ